ncbi:M12 family metallopeptidase [Pleionea sediminis]|uniref:M12 family metallopeptidase n=1 Tax=Pleionea sediminis TaxID=2569479 RepID=UPI0013DDF6D5|nr:M12 family metallopeptidase [Pleionea sediminis]
MLFNKFLIFTLALSISYSVNAKENETDSQMLTPHLSKDSLFGFSSEDRELFEITTDTGEVILAVDVDGVAYSGDMILGETKKLKQFGLKIVTGQEAPPEFEGPSAATRYPSSGYKWNNGIVPYQLASNLGSQARQAINYAINHWNSKTNVRFVRRSNQRDYILVQNGSGCSSMVGRQGGRQIVNLADACGRGAAVHELGHALGFFHEQTRTDRDSYVTIYWNNIQRGMEYNFNKINSREGRDHGRYDYRSIMHYPTTAFSTNGQATIWPKQGGVDTRNLGKYFSLSSGDIAATAAIYGSNGGGDDGDDDNNNGETYRGNLSGTGDYDIQPNGNWFQYSGGRLRATLRGPNNANFDLFLYRWNGSEWQEVRRSTSGNSNESLSFNASSGYYYFSIYSAQGRGSYTFNLQK